MKTQIHKIHSMLIHLDDYKLRLLDIIYVLMSSFWHVHSFNCKSVWRVSFPQQTPMVLLPSRLPIFCFLLLLFAFGCYFWSITMQHKWCVRILNKLYVTRFSCLCRRWDFHSNATRVFRYHCRRPQKEMDDSDQKETAMNWRELKREIERERLKENTFFGCEWVIFNVN